jgi:hypothetical protein
MRILELWIMGMWLILSNVGFRWRAPIFFSWQRKIEKLVYKQMKGEEGAVG